MKYPHPDGGARPPSLAPPPRPTGPRSITYREGRVRIVRPEAKKDNPQDTEEERVRIAKSSLKKRRRKSRKSEVLSLIEKEEWIAVEKKEYGLPKECEKT